MKIEPLNITVRDIVEDYKDDGDNGVVGYGGRLDIRPPFQREFVYKEDERNAVIHSVINQYPLNAMYWAEKGGGRFEIIDGQQRTISIAQYVEEQYFSVKITSSSLEEQFFDGLDRDVQEKVLDYPLMVYVCRGTDREKLAWFKIVNIAGLELTQQEIRNSTYTGPWLYDAKKSFSARGCRAYQIGSSYIVSGKHKTPDRQFYLETALKWINNNDLEEVEKYMARHRNDENATSLWEGFRSIIDWIEETFTQKRPKIMKGVDWGSLYNEFKDANLDPVEIEAETARLVLDDDVTNQKGIYPYILTGDEKHLNIRAFTAGMKQRVYEKQAGQCPICQIGFDISDMEADHITPWSEGGKTLEENCQMLCRKCNREKAAR